MSILVTCAECANSFKVKDRYAGKTGACPLCKATLEVPDEQMEFVVGQEHRASREGVTASSMSLLEQVPMEACRSCSKQIISGSIKCYYCGSDVPHPEA